ncbi:MAG: hypothetical protein Q9M41_07885 [Paracoccaceae bacterium]|nr:hypothetical protein [Paracoccaceae bacterium]
MKLLFHIGTEKTGTTSMQNWLAENRVQLLKHGVFACRSLGALSNRKISLWAQDESRPDRGFLSLGITTATQRRAFRQSLPATFAAEVAKARDLGCRIMVISNEHCHSRLRSQAEVNRAADFLAPHFAQIEILCALRPQIDMAISLASTLSRQRHRVDRRFLRRVVPENPYYDLDSLVSRWETAFGAHNVTLVPYRHFPDMAAWLAAHLGVDDRSLHPARRSNGPLDVQTMALINALDVPIFLQDGQRNPSAELFLDKLPCAEPLRIGRDLARNIQARFVAANQRLVARRPDLPAGCLEPDWQRHEGAANLHVLDEACAFSPQLGRLIRIFNERLVFERLNTALAQAEYALAQGQQGLAHGHLARAGGLAEKLTAGRHFRREAAAAKARITALHRQITPLGENRGG